MPSEHREKEVGSRDGEYVLFVQPGDRERGGVERIGTEQGMLKGAFKKKAERGGDGRTEHNDKQYDQHQKCNVKVGEVENQNISDRVRIGGESQEDTAFVYTRTIERSLGL